jgi:Holliday junction resolvase-like predicted endonuclease
VPRFPTLFALLALVAFAAYLALLIRRWWKARILLTRMQLASEGEQSAERFLLAQGHTILERQALQRATMHINNRVAEFDVRADLIVQMGSDIALVEVKTGDAADPRHPATRRQLREYADLFDVDRLFLFDATSQKLHEIHFPEA